MLRLPNPWTVPVVTIPIAAELLGMSTAAGYRAVDRGDIPVLGGGRYGRRVSVFALYGLLGAPIPARPIAPTVSR